MLYRRDGHEIAAELRQRICMMQSVSEEMILHEGALASEFGVSRTPIRQVLQKLAHERLVETRSGVGTIVSPLDPDKRDRDVQVLRALFVAAASCSVEAGVPAQMPERLVAAAAVAEVSSPGKQSYLDSRTELLDITARAAPDDILADSLRTAHWRHIRWSMAERVWDRPGAPERLIGTLRGCAEAAQRDSLSEVYTHLAEQVA